MAETLSYVYRFEKGTEADARSLLLLHGTGADENDPVPLGRMVAPGAPLLSVRGKVLENGMPRFFRRFGEGIFDEDDLRQPVHAYAADILPSRALPQRQMVLWMTQDFTNPMLPPGINTERFHAGIALALKQMAERGWHADKTVLSLTPAPIPSPSPRSERYRW
jgi:hypothetical protein